MSIYINDNDFSIKINAEKIKKELIENIIKEEDYIKKDNKKKEIVKTCSSYKQFCDIVDCINMKPFKVYEQDIDYDKYVNSYEYQWKLKQNKIENKNTQNHLSYLKYYYENKTLEPCINTTNIIKESEKLINLIIKNKDYYKLIKSYNNDEIKDLIIFIANNIDLIKDKIYEIKENIKDTNNENKNQINLTQFVNFFFCISNYWKQNEFSIFFEKDELYNINLNLNIIIEKIENNFQINNELKNQLLFIKKTFSIC